MEEIWKDITGYEGLYQVSNLGRVKSLVRKGRKKEKLLSLCSNTHGYIMVILSKNNIKSTHIAHILVANAFIPNPNNLPFVMHINDIRNDNNVNNLKWGTRQDNMDDMVNKNRQSKGENHGNSVLSEYEVIQIKTLRQNNGWGSKKIAKYLSLPKEAVSGVIYNNRWKHIIL